MLAFTSATAAFLAPTSSVVHTRTPAPAMAERCEMDPAVLDRYMGLSSGGKIQAEYIFIDNVRGSTNRARAPHAPSECR